MALRRNKDGSAVTPHQVFTTEAQTGARELHKQRQLDKAQRLTERQEARAERSSQDQLTRLNKLLGKGIGAKKERARLALAIEGSFVERPKKKQKKGKK